MNILILGGGESGIGSALLAKSMHYNVFVSDGAKIKDNFKTELLENNIDFEEESDSYDKLFQADLVVKSPGIPDNAEIVQSLKDKNIPVISEIEFAAQHTNAKIIAITGSNGKTTTTALTYHLLKEAGLDVALGGNIGKSFARIVAEAKNDYYVLEISSFQLDGIVNFKPDIAILLNITPDHLDRYDYSFDNYIKSKFRIGMNQSAEDIFIYSGDDSVVCSQLENFKLKAQSIKIEQPLVTDGILKIGDFTCNANDISIKGPHNEINAACAISAALQLGIDHNSIKKSLKSFVNLPHRLEWVKNIRGVNFINDSKATNVDATFFGLKAMDKPTIWIVGGIDKGNDYAPLMPLVKEKVKAIVCLGVDNQKIINCFGGEITAIAETQSAENAVKTAFSIAQSGDNILLSPACASFDLFKNYEDRGDKFKLAVFELSKTLEN